MVPGEFAKLVRRRHALESCQQTSAVAVPRTGEHVTVIDVVEGDITEIAVDAIVNAANSSLLGGGGVDGAIHRAGGPEILTECRALRATTLPDGLPAGDAVATTAGRLPARWVIHTVGPVYAPDDDRSPILRSAYRRSLMVADELGAATVAFPLISAGIYGWPVGDAAAHAVSAIRATTTSVAAVTLVGFSAAIADVLRRAVAAD
jgi:O-acetyl-ADP-ribose deacetylase (regulator of RNase III)